MRTMNVLKRTALLIILMVAFISCKQELRYSQSSPQIDDWNKTVADYENGDWEQFRAHFSDSAEIYRNSTEAITADDIVAAHKETLAQYSSYGFVEGEGDVEMVVTDDGETWVNFWGTWKGTMTANGKEYTLPIHVTSQYVDGKILKYHEYWDGTEIALDVQAMQAAAAAAEAMEDEPEE